ncbi:RNA polymerase sigma-70 factor, ECF subfamily [Pedobacter terrae]|uniref:RNA polymerase sigma-70 factor, ECF subfamily n=1 Tax=Pedobacter terrae TaxID=405671 RepID=A0A1G7UTP7_9SPHI|nr:RNA polymerase sigma-70 factor [Pedobacter terrae]SDG50708.1 RNA polymerase sigma-70 factor, ECF subfamily [Pedobacter terrae]
MEEEASKTLHINEFETMFRRNHQFLCAVAMQYVHDQFTAEDMVQDFFIDFWQRRNTIQLTTSFEAYARRAVKYKCIDFLRKSAVTEKRNLMLAVLEKEQEDADELENNEIRHQRYTKIVELIQKLPESRQNIFIMHAVDKMSYAEIAKKQNISINTVKTQLSRAYSALRNHLILICISFIHYQSIFKFILEKK